MAVGAGGAPTWSTPFYDTPVSTSAPHARVYAGFWTRFFAQVIDSLIAIAIGALPGFFLLFVTRGSGYALILLLIGVLAGFVLYHLIAVAYGGGFGMRAAGIAIVRAGDGRRPGFLRSGVRLVVRTTLSAIPLMGGIVGVVENLWMVKDPRKQTWHDKAAGTCVIERRTA